MKTTTNFFTLLFITAVLSTTLSCKQENKNPEKEDMHKSATFEELGQMNRDFAKAMNGYRTGKYRSLYARLSRCWLC